MSSNLGPGGMPCGCLAFGIVAISSCAAEGRPGSGGEISTHTHDTTIPFANMRSDRYFWRRPRTCFQQASGIQQRSNSNQWVFIIFFSGLFFIDNYICECISWWIVVLLCLFCIRSPCMLMKTRRFPRVDAFERGSIFKVIWMRFQNTLLHIFYNLTVAFQFPPLFPPGHIFIPFLYYLQSSKIFTNPELFAFSPPAISDPAWGRPLVIAAGTHSLAGWWPDSPAFQEVSLPSKILYPCFSI